MPPDRRVNPRLVSLLADMVEAAMRKDGVGVESAAKAAKCRRR